MNIRIGNDIKMQVTLRGISEYKQCNIKQIRCYLINTSMEHDCAKPHHKRYPHEPFPQFYTPSKYTLHENCRFEYNVDPCNVKCDYSQFGSGFHDYHIWPHYHGFGIKPGHFVDPCCHHGHYHYHTCKPDLRYLAPSKVSQEENKITLWFPARDQRYCGQYRLTIVLVMYEPGWEKNDLHTYTIDYDYIFNLVDDETGQTGYISIDLDNNTIVGGDKPTKPGVGDGCCCDYTGLENSIKSLVSKVDELSTKVDNIECNCNCGGNTPTPDVYKFTANANTINVPPFGVSTTVEVTSTKNDKFIDFAYTVSDNSVTINKNQGLLEIDVPANDTTKAKNITIRLTQNESGNVLLISIKQDAGTIITPTPTLTGIHASSSNVSLYYNTNSNIKLYADYSDGTSKELNFETDNYTWSYTGNLLFMIDEDGCFFQDEHDEDFVGSFPVTITYNYKGFSTQVVVTLIGTKVLMNYLGYSTTPSMDEVEYEIGTENNEYHHFIEVSNDNLFKTHECLSVQGGYFWAVTNVEIGDLKMSGLMLPYDYIGKKGDYHYYRSRTSIKGGFTIKITVER